LSISVLNLNNFEVRKQYKLLDKFLLY